MFRVMTNGLAWILLGMLFFMAIGVLGEVIDIVAILIEGRYEKQRKNY